MSTVLPITKLTFMTLMTLMAKVKKVAKAEHDAKKAARARAGRFKNQKESDIPKTSIFSASSLDILTSGGEGGSTHGMQSEKEESTNESCSDFWERTRLRKRRSLRWEFSSRSGNGESTVAGKIAAISALNAYLKSTEGTGGCNYPTDHSKLSGDTVCSRGFWEGVAGYFVYTYKSRTDNRLASTTVEEYMRKAMGVFRDKFGHLQGNVSHREFFKGIDEKR